MPDAPITSSRAGIVLTIALILIMTGGCAQPNTRPVEVQRTVSRTTTELDPVVSSTTAPTQPATRETITETAIYDQGEPHYPGKYFAGGRGGGGGGGGGGGPSGGIPGYGPYGRYRVSGPFLIGFSVDWFTYEFDDPGDEVDVFPATPVDLDVESVGLSVWGEYEFQSLGESGFGSRIRPFIGAGVGVGFLSGDDVAGVTTGGGAYDLELEGDTEFIPGAVAGVRIDLNDHLILELGARYDYHITDLEVTDNVTGRSEDVDDYDTFGGYVGLQFRW